MANEFAGVEEKLKRTNECIGNLKSEISRFFQESKYPTIPENDRQILLEAIEYHQKLIMPLRFSVLSGEIIHHLRSCLDHVIWIFSSIQYRKEHVRKIEFPVFDKEPIKKKDITRYEGKIKGITNSAVLSFIESLQPYNSPDPADTAIFVIHYFDVIDKHRELLLCSPIGERQVSPDQMDWVTNYAREHPEVTASELALKLKGHGKLAPQISFRNFGRREIQPVIPALTQLFNFVVVLMKDFEKLL